MNEPDGQEQRMAESIELAEQDMWQADVDQLLADEDQDARLMEQAERRMCAFAELGLEGVAR